MDKKHKLSEFDLERQSVWSFPERGDWYTHKPEYRGNFAPQIPRNIILRYSKVGNTVLDPMVGGGTTGVECKLTGRNFIGLDINPKAVELSRNAMHFKKPTEVPKSTYSIKAGNVNDISTIKDSSIDLIITHPPYLNIIKYSEGKISEDLSNIGSVKKFCETFRSGIWEMYRVLKSDSYLAILIGDTRKRRHYVPLAYNVMNEFLKAGFILKEDIIKIQHNCKTTPYWVKQAEKYNILLIMHEHLFVFRKPDQSENTSIYRNSMGWI